VLVAKVAERLVEIGSEFASERMRVQPNRRSIGERNRNAVHFWLDHHRDFFVRQEAPDAGIKVFHFVF